MKAPDTAVGPENDVLIPRPQSRPTTRLSSLSCSDYGAVQSTLAAALTRLNDMERADL